MARSILLGIFGILLLAGCQSERDAGAYSKSNYGDSLSPESIKFADDVKSNTDDVADISQLEFINRHGEKVAIADFKGDKNVILVFMRGFSGTLCPFCQTQTSRLISNYSKFEQRDSEILVVYPGSADSVAPFLRAVTGEEKQEVAKVPFAILLDEDLKAVEFLKIRESLALPSTYILDKQGQIRFAYVGTDATDRPSVNALLQQLDLINE